MSTEASQPGQSSDADAPAKKVPAPNAKSLRDVPGQQGPAADLDPDIQPVPRDQAVREAADGDADNTETCRLVIKPENG